MNNATKTIINELARGVLARAKDEERQLAAAQPDPPPAVILAKTETEREVDKHYETNTVTAEGGREAFLPPPVLLAEREEEK